MRRIILQWIGEGKSPVPKPPRLAPTSLAPKAAPKSRSATVHSTEPQAKQLLLAEPQELLLPSGEQHVNFWAWVYRGLWVIFLGTMLTLAIDVYVLGWSDPLTQRLLTYIPLPYAVVEYHPIWYGSFFNEYNALEKFRQQQSPNQPALEPKDIGAILIRRTVANNLAWNLGLWVSEHEVAEAFNKLVAEAGSIEQVQTTVQNLWGMTPEDYKQRVLRPYLLKQKLLQALAADPVISRKLGGGRDLAALDRYLDTLRGTMNIWVFGSN